MIFNNWQYIYSNGKFEIIPDIKIEKPKTLFKLYELNNNSIDAITNQYIYANHPFHFNDLFDCTSYLLKVSKKYYLEKIYDSSSFQESKKYSLNINLPESNTEVVQEMSESIHKILAVLCLTTDLNNILMWSYYTHHKGFCVEFDYTKFNFKHYGPFPINYQNNPSVFEIDSDNDLRLGIIYQSNIKFKEWQHENEWRLLIEAPKGASFANPFNAKSLEYPIHDRKFYYKIDTIVSVTLGNRFFDKGEIKIIDNNELAVEFKPKNQKKLLFDFLSKNEIITKIVLQEKLFELNFRPCKIHNLKNNKYKIIAIN